MECENDEYCHYWCPALNHSNCSCLSFHETRVILLMVFCLVWTALGVLVVGYYNKHLDCCNMINFFNIKEGMNGK